MNKLAVITDSATATGFRLAGAETYEAETPEQLRFKLLELIQKEGYGLIAVNSRLSEDLGEEVDRLLRNKALPVVLPFPVPERGRVESGEEYLSKLVKQAIGFYVKLA
jgi:V/A-type H+-transporting ATPase subunit F